MLVLFFFIFVSRLLLGREAFFGQIFAYTEAQVIAMTEYIKTYHSGVSTKDTDTIAGTSVLFEKKVLLILALLKVLSVIISFL